MVVMRIAGHLLFYFSERGFQRLVGAHSNSALSIPSSQIAVDIGTADTSGYIIEVVGNAYRRRHTQAICSKSPKPSTYDKGVFHTSTNKCFNFFLLFPFDLLERYISGGACGRCGNAKRFQETVENNAPLLARKATF